MIDIEIGVPFAEDAGWPHSWQNLALGSNLVLHDDHAVDVSGLNGFWQYEQNLEDCGWSLSQPSHALVALSSSSVSSRRNGKGESMFLRCLDFGLRSWI